MGERSGAAGRDPSAERRIALVRVTGELLRDLLGLPDGSEILGASSEAYFDGTDFVLRVAHRDFPPTPPGHPLPWVTPELRRNFDCEYCKQFTVEFVGWHGLPGVKGG